MAPLRTVFLLQDLKFGGTQTQALALARGLPADRFAVEVWTMAAGEDLDPAPVPRVKLADGSVVFARAIAALGRALKRSPPDLLVLWTVVPNRWGRILGRWAGARAIVGNCRDGSAPRRQHERWLWRFADRVVCNSGSQRRELVESLGVPAARVSVVYNGVDVARFAPGPAFREPVLLNVARLVPKKDHGTLLAALRIVRQRRPDVRLRIAGDGPLASSLRASVRDLPPDSVEWLAARRDPVPLYRGCAAVVLSSLVEGLPNVALEAMACGRPVVATAVDGVPEVVEHGRTGWLVPPGDPGRLAEALLEWLADPARAEAMGAAGREKIVSSFSMEAMIQRYAEVFEQALASRRRVAADGLL
ncbi:MAG TPA: glycosyltransferase family 4 protein [Kiritimatiellia bacterium]|nr:glycosyltransferase family 4 protein [Kiritimatiellia bacterium]HSA17447.1 glycosyltransferase family 4 protein [Kiritimatiellia bacterium]